MREEGFTLIEAMVVVLIVSILIVIGVVYMQAGRGERYERRNVDGYECSWDNWRDQVVQGTCEKEGLK